MDNLSFRFAVPGDEALVLQFIRDLAAYEKMTEDVIATEEDLHHWLFEDQRVEVLFAVVDGKEVGFALFCSNFSTFLGRPGIHLEDFFVKQDYRGQGIGTAILHELQRIIRERGYGRLEWACLDWNQPSRDFYTNFGAEEMSDWITYRMPPEE